MHVVGVFFALPVFPHPPCPGRHARHLSAERTIACPWSPMCQVPEPPPRPSGEVRGCRYTYSLGKLDGDANLQTILTPLIPVTAREISSQIIHTSRASSSHLVRHATPRQCIALVLAWFAMSKLQVASGSRPRCASNLDMLPIWASKIKDNIAYPTYARRLF